MTEKSPWARDDLPEPTPREKAVPLVTPDKEHGRLFFYSPADETMLDEVRADIVSLTVDPREKNGPTWLPDKEVPSGFVRLACLCSKDDWSEYEITELVKLAKQNRENFDGDQILDVLRSQQGRPSQPLEDMPEPIQDIFSAIFGGRAPPPGVSVRVLGPGDIPPSLRNGRRPRPRPGAHDSIRIRIGDLDDDDA